MQLMSVEYKNIWQTQFTRIFLSYRSSKLFIYCLSNTYTIRVFFYAIWRHRTWETLAQVMACTKPLPEPMLTNCHRGPVAYTWVIFHRKCSRYLSLNWVWDPVWGPRYGILLCYWTPLIARFMGPTWGPSGADRTQVGPILGPWTLLSWTVHRVWLHFNICATDHQRKYISVHVIISSTQYSYF